MFTYNVYTVPFIVLISMFYEYLNKNKGFCILKRLNEVIEYINDLCKYNRFAEGTVSASLHTGAKFNIAW